MESLEQFMNNFLVDSLKKYPKEFVKKYMENFLKKSMEKIILFERIS